MSDEEKLLERLTAYLSDDQKHTLRIYGHGVSGKSTFARKLQLILGEERANLLATDPYVIVGEYRDLLSSKDFPHQKVTACLPAVHELSSLERDIRALQSGLDILTIGTAWASSLRLSAQKPILIVEGMSAAFLPKNLFDLPICFHTDEGTELERRLARDTQPFEVAMCTGFSKRTLAAASNMNTTIKCIRKRLIFSSARLKRALE